MNETHRIRFSSGSEAGSTRPALVWQWEYEDGYISTIVLPHQNLDAAKIYIEEETGPMVWRRHEPRERYELDEYGGYTLGMATTTI